MFEFSYNECERACAVVAEEIKKQSPDKYKYVYGVPRGGCVPAVMLCNMLGLSLVKAPVSMENTLIVDDVLDSGETLKDYVKQGYDTFCLIYKGISPFSPTYYTKMTDEWVVFDWEIKNTKPTSELVRMLQYIKDDDHFNAIIKKLTE